MESSTVTVIKPGLLIDGLGGHPVKGPTVVLKENLIHWIGASEEVGANQEIAAMVNSAGDQRVFDLPQCTLLPGLIDCHSHTNMPGDGRTGEEVAEDTDDVRLLRAARNTTIALRSGVTTLCDCGSWNTTAFSVKQGISMGLVDGPRFLVSGPPLTTTGGHLWYMGGEADGIDGVSRQVRYLIKQGADLIKITASGGSTLTSDPYRPSYTVGELKAIVCEAHNRARPVAAHCRSTVSINNALDAGVDMIFHCFFAEPDGSYKYDQATAERLALSGTWLNPTHAIGISRQIQLLEMQKQGPLGKVDAEMLQRITNGHRERIEAFGKMVDMGANLIGGSDCGWGSYPFGDFQAEIISMADFGLSPMQAIMTGTRNAAQALGKLDSLGTVEQGKEADLILVEGNPLENMECLRSVEAVILGGRLVGVSPE
ncbi:MAG: hypothetical protein BZY75_02440 [SAR202 cluster bacterium Io17-Chloro-G7]|nr:MAG: hypothetical protein BZY75_02440 [SAR202 cluster bacterium Io17-Chloro-G7]